MYFNENNSNTNIDKEFNQEKNNLSHILFLLNKYKLFIIGIVIILIILMIFIILNRKINHTTKTNLYCLFAICLKNMQRIMGTEKRLLLCMASFFSIKISAAVRRFLVENSFSKNKNHPAAEAVG